VIQHLLDDFDQFDGIVEIAEVQHLLWPSAAVVPLVGILAEVIDAVGVEPAGPSLDAMEHIAVIRQQVGRVTALVVR